MAFVGGSAGVRSIPAERRRVSRRRPITCLIMDRRVLVSAGGIAAVAAAAVIGGRVLSMLAPATAPTLAKKEHQVPFGVVEGQNRGPDAMDPPTYIEDPYFWVRDDTRKNREVIEHLKKENKYTEKVMSPLKADVENLYKEMFSHIQETDSAVPYKHGPFLYYTRTMEGSSYKLHCRKSVGSDEERILVDENKLAKGQKYCNVARVAPSPSHNLLAYTIDNSGYELYKLVVVDLTTGKTIDDKLETVGGGVTWGKSDRYIYFSTFDDAHRSNKVWRHEIGKDVAEDINLHSEDDEVFSAGFGKTRSGRLMIIGSESSETSEYKFIDLESEEAAKLQMVAAREKGVLYDVDHYKGKLYIVTNRGGATNFKLVSAPLNTPGPENWSEVLPYDAKMKMDSFNAFEDFAVISGREGGFSQLWLMKGEDAASLSEFSFDEEVHSVRPSVNREFETDKFRFSYSSLTTPAQTIDTNIKTGERELLKEEPVLNFDRSLYDSKRIELTTPDGTIVPMSLAFKKGLLTDGKGPKPCYLYGYGSYEISVDPDFRSSYLPILDRGVVIALAHVRGGGEMGRQHYEGAKYLTKKNTFKDFVTCAEHLISNGITTPDRLAIEGRSAGGLLMGAVLNMRPDLFRVVLAGVPFVDVMNSMSDPSIPLTTGEWEEWGNPNEKKYFDYMLSYSPYENVKEAKYPAMLVTSGLYDSRVAYWEPTKWVAKLRENNAGEEAILLKMDLGSGHFSASDRYKYVRERAFELAFLLDKLGVLHAK